MLSSSRIGLVRCEHCNRQFNPHSAARHIPWCAKQQSAKNRNRLSEEKREALERYKWRIGYRPSNSLQQYSQHQHQRQAAPLVRLKKSSINSSSSATSASSSASLSSKARQSTSSSSRHQLQRSVSSLTLTKQPSGGWAPAKGPQPKRTKSVSDVSCIVASLAKRVEEIFAQNQMLLAAMSISKLSSPAANKSADSEDSDGASHQAKCHHCKSARLAAANYCHKCGCKLRCPSSSASSPG